MTISADVTIKFKFNNICSLEDLYDTGMTLREMVELLINEDSLMGCVEDDYEILSVVANDES